MPDYSPSDRDMMVRTVIGEAEREPSIGQAAVAHVILNRLGQYGNTPSDVVLARGQFEPWSTRARELLAVKPDSERYKKAATIVDDVLSGRVPDPTGGATHFLNPEVVKARRGGKLPEWASGDGIRIGSHAFYRPNAQEGISQAIGERGTPQPMAFNDDLIGEWRSAPKTAAPAPSAPKEDDLVSEWLPTKAAAPSQETPAQAPNPSPTPGREHQAEALARIVREHQGDDWTDTAIRFGAGAGRGLGDIADTLAQGIAAVGERGAHALEHAGVISPETAARVAQWRGGVNADIAKGNELFTNATGDALAPEAGRIAGQIAGTAPFLGAGGRVIAGALRGSPVASTLAARPVVSSALGGAGVGAGASALTSAASDEPLSDQLMQGAGTGAVLGPIGHGVGRLAAKISGSGIDHETAALAQAARNKYGIPLRADQLSANPMVRFAGSVMQRLPFTGLGEHVAEQGGAFNRAIAKEFGEDTDKITKPIIRRAAQRIGAVFDDVARRTGAIRIDHPFVNDVQRIASEARTSLGRDAAPIEDQIMRIADRIKNGSLDADAYQSLTRKDTPFDRAMKSKDPNVRFYASQLREALDDVMQRSAPADVVADLKKARYQWAIMKAVEPLAKKAPTGNISPALLATRAKGGNLDELGAIGQRFLKEPPSSGTAERLASLKLGAALAGGLGGLGGAYYFDPENFQRDAALLGGGLVAARGGGAALKSKILTNAIIRRGQNLNPRGRNVLNPALLPTAGALLNRGETLPAAP